MKYAMEYAPLIWMFMAGYALFTGHYYESAVLSGLVYFGLER